MDLNMLLKYLSGDPSSSAAGAGNGLTTLRSLDVDTRGGVITRSADADKSGPAGVSPAPLTKEWLGSHFACVGELYAPDLSLGSCTVIADGDYAVTASHIVSARHDELFVGLGPRDKAGEHQDKRKVTHIYWQSGESYKLDCTDDWPATASSYKDENDRLVVLKLESAFAKTFEPFALLPAGSEPTPGDLLVVAGWGHDQNGIFPDVVWVGTTRCRAWLHGWRGVHARDRHDLFNGMPAANDSGGPVFFPPLHDPYGGKHLRLVGVHSARMAPHFRPEQVGLYLPIDPVAEDWVLGRIKRNTRTSIVATKTPTVPDEEFSFRNRYKCFTLPANPAYWVENPNPLNSKPFRTFTLKTKGASKLLRPESELRLSVVNGGVVMTTELPDGSGDRRSIQLKPKGAANAKYWWVGKDPDDDSEYYVMILSAAAVRDRKNRIRVEAFFRDSDHRRPSEAVINADSGVRTPPALGYNPMMPFTHDQDDEGNGYET